MRLNWHRTVLHSVLLAAVVAAAGAAGEVTVSVTAVPDVVDTQEVFDVIVSVDTPTNLAQVVADIGFDPVIVEPVEGSFVWNGARLPNGLSLCNALFLPAGAGNRARIDVSGVREFKDAVSAGSGELVRFTLRGRSGGESGLTPSGSYRVAPYYLTDVPAQAVAATVTVLGPGAIVFTPADDLPFNVPPNVTLDSANSTAIHYTTDGTAPDLASPLYAEPIPVVAPDGGQMTIRALALDDHGRETRGAATYHLDLTGPVPTITPAADQPDPSNAAAIRFVVAFSEPVFGFADDDIVLGGDAQPAGAAVTALGGNRYEVAVSGMTQDGAVTITLVESAVTDAAGNPNTEAVLADNRVDYDRTPPVATLDSHPAQRDPANSLPIVYTVVFSEPVVGFTAGDVQITAAGAPPTVNVLAADPPDGRHFLVQVEGVAADGAVTFDVPAGGVPDLAGNVNAASQAGDVTVVYDTTPPAPPVILAPADLSVRTNAVVRVAGTAEPGSRVEILDGETGIGSVFAAPGAGAWQFTTAERTDGQHVLQARATDPAGNTGALAAVTVTIDSSFTARADWAVSSEGWTQWRDGDVPLEHVPAGGFGDAGHVVCDLSQLRPNIAGAYWPLYLVPPASEPTNGDFNPSSLFVALKAVTDIDLRGGTVVFFVGEWNAADDYTFYLMKQGVRAADVAADGLWREVLILISAHPDDWSAPFTAGRAAKPLADLLVRPQQWGLAIRGADGQPSGMLAFDALSATRGPVCAFDRADGQTSPVKAGPVRFLVGFQRPVTGFDAADVALLGSAQAQTKAVEDVAGSEGRQYTVTVDGMLQDGVVMIDVPPGAALDADGKASQRGIAAGPTRVVYDTTAPTVGPVSIASDNPRPDLARPGDTVTLAFTVGEPLSAAPVVTLAGLPADVVAAGRDAVSYTATRLMQPGDPEGAVSFSIICTDVAGNAAVAVTATSDGSQVVFDETAPAVTVEPLLTNDPSPGLAGTVDDPTAAVQVQVGGNAYAAVNHGDGTWTLGAGAVGPLADGVHEVSVTATDPAGNAGTDASAGELTVDRTPPVVTLALAAGQPSPTNQLPVRFLLTLSEAVTVLGVGDLAVTVPGDPSEVTLELTEPLDGLHYLVRVAGLTADGPVHVTVPDGQLHDLAGNGSSPVAGGGVEAIYDTTAPTLTVVSIASDNPRPELARPGDIVTLAFTVGEPLSAAPVVTLAGLPADVVAAGRDAVSYLATRLMQPGDPEGAVSFAIACTDVAGNAAAAVTATSDGSQVVFDETAPAVTVERLLTNDPSPGLAGTVNDPTAAVQVQVGGSAYAAVNHGDGTWTLGAGAIGPLADGVHEVSVTATDPAGNAGTDGSAAELEVDTVPPAAVIELAPGQAAVTNQPPVRFRITFSEPVYGLSPANVLFQCPSQPTSAQVTAVGRADGTVFEVSVAGMTQEGLTYISFGAGAAADAAGNGCEASPADTPSVLYDITPPVVDSVTVADPTPATGGLTNQRAVSVTMAAHDALSAIVGWALTETPDLPTPDSPLWQATAPLGFTLLGGEGVCPVYAWVRDAAGNVSEPSEQARTAITLDLTPPAAALVWLNPSRFTVSFDEPVLGAGAAECYSFLDAAGQPALTVVSVVPAAGEDTIVTLGQRPAALYQLVVSGITDLAGNPVDNSPGATTGGFLALIVGDTVYAFGELDGATDDFDDDVDVPLDPPDFGRVAYFSHPESADPAESMLLHDFRAPSDGVLRWRFAVEAAAGREATLTWDADAASPDKALYVVPVEAESPAGTVIDMTAGVGPVELPAAGEFEILYGVPEADYRIVLDPGWNLLGSPLVTTTTAGAFLGVGLRDGALAPVWRLAPDGYAATDLDQPLPAEVGCWVYSPAGGEATDGAGLQTDGAVCLRTGWNLISPAARFSLARPGCEPLRGRTWRWDAAWQTYAPVPDDGQLEPGAAYWVYIETAGPCLTPDP